MANNWIEHVRNFAKENNMTYSCALSDPRCKQSYQPTINLTPRFSKLMNLVKVGKTGRQPTSEKIETARGQFNQLKAIVMDLPETVKKREYVRRLAPIRERIQFLKKLVLNIST